MLPQVAIEYGWTVEEFLGYTSRDKAGIGWDGWKNAEIFIYEGLGSRRKQEMTMYHVVGTAVTVTLLYLISLFLLQDRDFFTGIPQKILELGACNYIPLYCTGRNIHGSPDKLQMECSVY